MLSARSAHLLLAFSVFRRISSRQCVWNSSAIFSPYFVLSAAEFYHHLPYWLVFFIAVLSFEPRSVLSPAIAIPLVCLPLFVPSSLRLIFEGLFAMDLSDFLSRKSLGDLAFPWMSRLNVGSKLLMMCCLEITNPAARSSFPDRWSKLCFSCHFLFMSLESDDFVWCLLVVILFALHFAESGFVLLESFFLSLFIYYLFLRRRRSLVGQYCMIFFSRVIPK